MMQTEIRIKFSTGKEIVLTKAEYDELMAGDRKTESVGYVHIFPTYQPCWEQDRPWWKDPVTTSMQTIPC
jgi:hypothetical protein